MAKRPVFFIENDSVKCMYMDFQWFPGFALTQKRKCITSLHKAISVIYPNAEPLEISTKGEIPLGNKLSAFNLIIDGYYLENVFQSSKVFNDDNSPHVEWLELQPREAKHEASKLHKEHELIGFKYDDVVYPLEPKSVFYDYIYYKSVKQCLTLEELSQLKNYTHFTDIEFSPKMSINTQARSAALIKLILDEFGELPDITGEEFISIHKKYIK